MSINSRAKGSRGERLFRDFLRETFGDSEARRGQQRKGGDDSPDVDSPMLGMLGIHPEVKFTGGCELTHPTMLRDWLYQAGRDAGSELEGVIFHKWNYSRWYAVFLTESGNTCIMEAEDFIEERLTRHKKLQAELDKLNGLSSTKETP